MRFAGHISWIVAAAVGVLVGARWLFGAYTLAGIPVNAPLNPEGIFGLLITGLLVARARAAIPSASGGFPAWGSAGAALMALFPALSIGFLSDDFILIHQARTVADVWAVFVNPGGDGFFRPFGYLSFDLNALVGGWHLTNLLLHAASSAMVARLAGRLGADWVASLLAGCIFAVHGTHLEAVVWVAGRFDVLATFFSLAALLLFGRNTTAALACTLAAVWSKEAAFVLPALIALLAWYEQRPWRACLPFWAMAGSAFLYRWWLLGGIGGYTTGSGEAAFFSLKLASTTKAVFIRVWTSLYFPLNWTTDPAPWIGVAACCYIAALLWLARSATLSRGVRVSLAGLALSILPPLHLLGGAADLSGGRLLYLPSVWFCLILALAANHVPWRGVVAATLMLFHFAALRHNLPYWQRAADQVRFICEQPAPPAELPRAIDGVPALANGYSECTDPANR